MNNIDEEDILSDSENDADIVEEWDNHYGEETESTEEVVVPKSKRIWDPEKKKKLKEKEVKDIVKTKLNYENKAIIDRTDDIASAFLKENSKNKHRDNFFPFMINKFECKTGAEIGVDKGEFSKHILSKTKIAKYYCVDTWQDDFGSDCKPGFYDKDGNKRYEEARKTLDEFSDRKEMLKMKSIEASNKMPYNSLDFVYIDGDHSLEGILFDLYSWCPKVKIGGICSGHDYKDGPRSGINDYFGKQLDYKVKTAVDYYCQRYGYKLNIVGGRILSWWFIRNR